MNVVGICGASGSGKTTLIERLLPRLTRQGQRVSVLKHAHVGFDLDRPGKDSWRLREAGAREVLLASSRRLALLREFGTDVELDVHALLRELSAVDWVLVEGFKHADIVKVEVWRDEVAAARGDRPLYPDDPFVAAVATDRPQALPVPTRLPVVPLDDAAALLDVLEQQGRRLHYDAHRHG